MAVLNAINNQGIAVGARSITKGGNNPHNAVIWDTNTGEVTDMGAIWILNSSARDINSSMAVAGVTGPALSPGQQAFLAYNNKTIIGMMPSGTSTDARGMNDNNLVVGGGTVVIDGIGTVPRGFVWDGEIFELIEPLPGFANSSANAINNVGQVAGASLITGGPTRAQLWQHGISIDLNDLTSGPTLTSAPDINNIGQILARASTRATLLTPMDVPVGDLNFDCRVDGHDLMILLS
jgi:probable HAF family extracellular repeat protein